MEAVIDSLANFFIQHPFAQVAAGYGGIIVVCLLVLLMVAGCLYMAFGKKHCYQFRQGSLSQWCWKVGWLLNIAAITDFISRMFTTGIKNISVTESILDYMPTVLYAFAIIYSIKYKAFHAKRRRVKKERT